jgi:hypothetical protein
MPQKVDIPNVGRVYFPDGMPPEQIAEAIERDILPQYSGGATPFQSAEARVRSRENALRQEPAEGPSVMARVGRGMEDVRQGLTQRILQLGEAPFRGSPADAVSIQELRAYASPEDQKLSDEELRAKARQLPSTSQAYTSSVNNELELYAKGREAQGGGVDLARIAGNVAGSAPLAVVGPAAATVPARAAAGAIQGALAGGAQFTPSGELSDTAKNAALGGVTGGVVAPVAGIAGDKALSLGQKLVGAWRGMSANASVDDILNSVPEFRALPQVAQRDLIAEAQEQLRRTGQLNAEQLARKANLVAHGVQPTKSMVTRNPGDWTMERNLSKLAGSPDEQLSTTGQQLVDLYEANDRALTNSLRRLSQNLPRGTPEAHGMRVMQSLDDLARASQDDVSRVYEAIRADIGDELAFDGKALSNVLDDLQDNAYAEKLVASVRNRLRRTGVIDADNQLTGNALTVSQAEELRKFVNKLPNDFGRRDIISAIDQDVLRGHRVGDVFKRQDLPKSLEHLRPDIDRVKQLEAAYNATRAKLKDAPTRETRSALEALLRRDKAALDEARESVLTQVPERTGAGNHFAEARAAAQSRFQMLENPATQRALNALGELKQGKTAQNFIKSQVIDAADQDVTSLVDALSRLPRGQAEEAMDALRAGVLQHLEDAAGNPNSARFSGAAFNRAIDDIGAAKLVRILGADQFQRLQSLARAALDATYEPPYSAVNHANSGTTLLSFLRGARTIPGVPLIVTDQTEKMAAQAAYRNQLAEALAARSQALLPQITPRAREAAAALRGAAAVTPIASAQQTRDRKNK